MAVERRRVADTIRVPGRFEIDPGGVREYRLPLAGRVIDVGVEQYHAVAPGDLLFRLDSPEWRGLQDEMADAHAAVATEHAAREVARAALSEGERAADLMHDRLESLEPLLDAIERHEQALEATIELWHAHIAQLEELHAAGGGKLTELADARTRLATVQTEHAQIEEECAEVEARRIDLTIQEAELRNLLPRLHAELGAREVAHANARAHLDLHTRLVADLVGLSPEELTAVDERDEPRWRTIHSLEVRASAPGVVQTEPAPEGSWLAANDIAVRTVDSAALRFRAVGLQSDLGRLRDGMPARIVPPVGGSLAFHDTMLGSLRIALEADADARTVDLVVTPAELTTWARPQVAAFLEVEVHVESEPVQLAIPEAAVVTDGLDRVFFLRDPNDKDKVIRTVADLGVSDGRWVVVRSEVMAGDEVVLHGAYELKLTGSGKAPEGGHFHSDGTWHAGPDH